MSKIIFLNGCGSAGKTSIARAIQYLSEDSWFTFGIDTFISMTPLPCLSDDKPDVRYFSFVPGINDRGPTMRVEVGQKVNNSLVSCQILLICLQVEETISLSMKSYLMMFTSNLA